MISVWKYPLLEIDTQVVRIPQGFQALSVQAQNDELCLWALVDPDAKFVDVSVEIFGTGHPMPRAHGKYVGTAQMKNGLVWHVFLRIV